MLTLSGMIVDNVGEEYINTYLRSKRYVKAEEQDGKSVEYRVNALIEQGELDLEDFEKFLLEELFYGKRKSIRFYKLDTAYKLKKPEDWLSKLRETYKVESLDFTEIMKTIPSPEHCLRIAAVSSDVDRKGNLEKIDILFVAYTEVSENGRIRSTVAYYPVEVDLTEKRIVIQAWNRQGLCEGYKLEEQFDHIAMILSLSFGVKTKPFMATHKKALHHMSRGLVTEVYNKIPSFNQIRELENPIQTFKQDVLKGLSLKNVKEQDGEKTLGKNIFDFEDEVEKMLEKLCISDYFYDIPYDEIWKMGVKTIVSKIKFKDLEHVLTILSSEASEAPIFCTKTFLSLKKSLEDAKLVERLWIEHDRSHGRLKLSYDATKDEYLEMRILSNIRFTEGDLLTAKEIYDSYAGDAVGKVKRGDQRCAV